MKAIPVILAALLAVSARAALELGPASADTNATRTTVDVLWRLAGTNTTSPTVTLYWAAADMGTNAGSWTFSTNLGAKILATYTNRIGALTASRPWYARLSAADPSNTVWTTNYAYSMTLSGAPTSPAPGHAFVPVMVSTGGVIVAPSNIADFVTGGGASLTNAAALAAAAAPTASLGTAAAADLGNNVGEVPIWYTGGTANTNPFIYFDTSYESFVGESASDHRNRLGLNTTYVAPTAFVARALAPGATGDGGGLSNVVLAHPTAPGWPKRMMVTVRSTTTALAAGGATNVFQTGLADRAIPDRLYSNIVAYTMQMRFSTNADVSAGYETNIGYRQSQVGSHGGSIVSLYTAPFFATYQTNYAVYGYAHSQCSMVTCSIPLVASPSFGCLGAYLIGVTPANYGPHAVSNLTYILVLELE